MVVPCVVAKVNFKVPGSPTVIFAVKSYQKEKSPAVNFKIIFSRSSITSANTSSTVGLSESLKGDVSSKLAAFTYAVLNAGA
ncbi:hypothetical protein D3C86_1994550 [compost metagenome]